VDDSGPGQNPLSMFSPIFAEADLNGHEPFYPKAARGNSQQKYVRQSEIWRNRSRTTRALPHEKISDVMRRCILTKAQMTWYMSSFLAAIYGLTMSSITDTAPLHTPFAFNGRRILPIWILGVLFSLILGLQSCGRGPADDSADFVAKSYEGRIVQIDHRGNAPDDAKIFLVTNGKKHWILSMEWFKNGENHGPVLFLTKSKLDSIPDGDPIR
jgi:hypothetical protein